MNIINQIKDIITKKGGFGKFIRYVLVGASAAVVDFAVFEVLFLLLGSDHPITFLSYSVQPEKIANTAALISGFIYSFILNRVWAFNSKNNMLLQIILMIMLLAFNTFISNEAISFMGRTLGIPFIFAKPIMQIVIVFWNYVIYDKIIYRTNSDSKNS